MDLNDNIKILCKIVHLTQHLILTNRGLEQLLHFYSIKECLRIKNIEWYRI